MMIDWEIEKLIKDIKDLERQIDRYINSTIDKSQDIRFKERQIDRKFEMIRTLQREREYAK